MSAEKQVDEMFLCSERDLEDDFIDSNKNIFCQKRGFGYWLWKPYLISRALDQIEFGDYLIYCDSASIITNPIDILFDLCGENNDILLFENMNGSLDKPWINKHWTKADCFNLMDCAESKYYDGLQVDAAFQVYRKTEKTVEFVKQYLGFCQNENILTDSSNITGPNLEGFVDHRHDQSVLSLLAIKNNVRLESCPSQWRRTNSLEKFPITFFHHKQKLAYAG